MREENAECTGQESINAAHSYGSSGKVNTGVGRDRSSNGWRWITKSFVLCPDSAGLLVSKVNGNIAIDFLAAHSHFRQLSRAKFQTEIPLRRQ